MAMFLNHCLEKKLSCSTCNLLWYEREIYFYHINLWIVDTLGGFFVPCFLGWCSMIGLGPMECGQNWCKTPPCLTFNVFCAHTSIWLSPCQGIVKAHDEDDVIKKYKKFRALSYHRTLISQTLYWLALRFWRPFLPSKTCPSLTMKLMRKSVMD